MDKIKIAYLHHINEITVRELHNKQFDSELLRSLYHSGTYLPGKFIEPLAFIKHLNSLYWLVKNNEGVYYFLTYSRSLGNIRQSAGTLDTVVKTIPEKAKNGKVLRKHILGQLSGKKAYGSIKFT